MHFKRKVIVFSSSWRFLLNLSSESDEDEDESEEEMAEEAEESDD